jgi:electron transport complex protein RnfB
LNAWIAGFPIVAAVVAPLLLMRRAASRVQGDADELVDARLVEAIERILPQTQCGQCGFAGCSPYAEALARREVDIDRCPPGGDDGARALAALLGREPKPVNPDNGVVKPALVAIVREADCIGCTKCIQACPVDAIIGAPKLMHTVIPDLCTGCELCIPPCPVDCIELVPDPRFARLAALG